MKDLQTENEALRKENFGLKEYLAEYRAAEQNRTLVKLPCRIGDSIFVIENYRYDKKVGIVIQERSVFERKVISFGIDNEEIRVITEYDVYPLQYEGRAFYFSREAAESAL